MRVGRATHLRCPLASGYTTASTGCAQAARLGHTDGLGLPGLTTQEEAMASKRVRKAVLVLAIVIPILVLAASWMTMMNGRFTYMVKY